MSAKAQEDLKRAIHTLGMKYEIRYHPDMSKRSKVYEGDDWSESSDDDDSPVWRSILPQLSPWIRNLGGSDGVSEEVSNAQCCSVVDLECVAKALGNIIIIIEQNLLRCSLTDVR